ncbi:hypothetical protein IG193_03515 [Infirmifilum lucidum]|uniref:Uncharacterized protein n=1 Tax=Infirmifilum lucidum TaxID=2776706 RepID=A0A7L9FI77_9CREN|nr:hypothetical protein [Infirmifilum lucidum]QOJ79538.1 hypothetical protein IG193_03515 [Infirmifilum lucidum]
MQTSITFTYLQAEKITEPPPGPLNVNIQLNFPINVSFSGNQLAAEFVASVESIPPVFSVKVKGRFTASGEARELEELNSKLLRGPPDPQLLQLVMSMTMFEIMLLLKELGIPPTLPIPVAPPQAPQSDTLRPL